MKSIGALFTEFNSDKDLGTARPGSGGHTYGPVYDKLLIPRRDSLTAVLEVGVLGGSSLRAWREWLSDACRVVGIDNNLTCGGIPGVELYQADSTDAASTWAALGDSTFDLIVDDGGHALHEQKATWGVMLSRVRPGGVFVCEDLQSIEAQEWFAEQGCEIVNRNGLSGRWDDVLAVHIKPGAS